MFKSILVPIDLAQPSSWQFAIPEALELSRSAQGRLTVMTVVREVGTIFGGVALGFQLETMVQEARNRLAEIVRPFEGAGNRIEQDVRFGSISHEILAAARDKAADLILMASHRPEMLDYLIGPNAAHVAQHATCSVLVLRKYAER